MGKMFGDYIVSAERRINDKSPLYYHTSVDTFIEIFLYKPAPTAIELNVSPGIRIKDLSRR
jgi:hypothetical protein